MSAKRRVTVLPARLLGATLTIVALAAAGAGAQPAAPGQPNPPANDNRGNAQVLSSLPASVNGTTGGATVEPSEPFSSCGSGADHTVWYQFTTGAQQRVAADLTANGKLDAVIDVYRQQRSQLTPVTCDDTDVHGKASLTFQSVKGASYLIRVAQRPGSESNTFALDVFHPREAEQPPGSALPSGGTQGQVDRIQDVNQAYSVTLHAGVSYRINLVNESQGACIGAGLFPPGTGSFDDGGAVLHMRCTSYRLFTPGAGAGGRYSIQVTPTSRFRGIQRFHLQVAPAGPGDTIPGLPLSNYAHAHGSIDGGHVTPLRLYRFDVTTRSNLTLRLTAPGRADVDLELRDDSGHRIACSCGGSGDETLAHQLTPGHYYAVLRARNGTSGRYTLVRESRTITRTTIAISSNRGSSPPGRNAPIVVRVSPNASGPITVTIDRFDPVSGWQFARVAHASVSGGSASIPFVPPSQGRWRAMAVFTGTRTASPSHSGFSEVLVAGPLHQ